MTAHNLWLFHEICYVAVDSLFNAQLLKQASMQSACLLVCTFVVFHAAAVAEEAAVEKTAEAAVLAFPLPCLHLRHQPLGKVRCQFLKCIRLIQTVLMESLCPGIQLLELKCVYLVIPCCIIHPLRSVAFTKCTHHCILSNDFGMATVRVR